MLLQADLTAVAPGPLESQLARRLQLVADVESRGGATVYRFTPGSVRRALDTGWTAVELHEFLGSVSRTPVPQPLSYLVDDTARTFGSVRVGHAEAFLRADDETALTELLHHPKAVGRWGCAGWRRRCWSAPRRSTSCCPGCASSAPRRSSRPRTAPCTWSAPTSAGPGRPASTAGAGPPPARRTATVSAVVTAIRSGRPGRVVPPGRRPRPRSPPSGSLAALRDAVETGTPVLIVYVDNHGTRSERIVDPVSVEGGVLTAHDHRSDDVRTFAVHRITAVRPISG